MHSGKHPNDPQALHLVGAGVDVLGARQLGHVLKMVGKEKLISNIVEVVTATRLKSAIS